MATSLSNTAIRRLTAEERKIRTEGKECGFFAVPRLIPAKDYSTWDIFIKGSDDSLYESTVMQVLMEFPHEYPIHPPKMTFITKMFHPNIYSDGRVCISILHVADDDPSSYETADEKWTPVQSIRTIVLSVISLLNEPNTNSPANVDASKLLNEDVEAYKNKVRFEAVKEGVKKDELLNGMLKGLSNGDKDILRDMFGARIAVKTDKPEIVDRRESRRG